MYVCTNESLSSIVKGLDIQPTDNVFAVGGSGDQAFAILEYANSVTLIDYLPEAVDFIKKRVDFLKQGKLEEFLYFKSNPASEGTKTRNKYFLSKNRLQKITSKLDNLTIIQSDVVLSEISKENNKIYLSNALGYNGYESLYNAKETLTNISNNMPIDGLIYVTNHEDLVAKEPLIGRKVDKWEKFKNKFFGNFRKLYEESCLPINLKVDGKLTAKARTESAKLESIRECYFFEPAVYRKIEN